MDKDLTKRVVAPLGVKTPQWRTYFCAAVTAEQVLAELPLPLVVKPDDSGSSIGVSIARTEGELRGALNAAAHESTRVIIEQYVAGREIQVGILDGKALPSIEIRPKTGFYDYKNKYQPGAAEEITPSPIPAEAETRVGAAAVTVYEALRLKVYSRADFIYDAAGEFWFLEINTLPGMGRFHPARGGFSRSDCLQPDRKAHFWKSPSRRRLFCSSPAENSPRRDSAPPAPARPPAGSPGR